MRTVYLFGFLYIGLSLAILGGLWPGGPSPGHPPVLGGSQPVAATGDVGEARSWFVSMKPYCNVVEVETRMRWQPHPASPQGAGYGAACYALAGRTDAARTLLMELPEDERWRAAGIVFDVGHPVADAGDDLSAGPIMELVVEFWPNHYMALYHAGAANYALGREGPARTHLERFLEHYEADDGWTGSARGMLARMSR